MPQAMDGVEIFEKGKVKWLRNNAARKAFVRFYHYRFGERFPRGLTWPMNPKPDEAPIGPIYTPGKSPIWHAYSIYKVSKRTALVDIDFPIVSLPLISDSDAKTIAKELDKIEKELAKVEDSAARGAIYVRHDLANLNPSSGRIDLEWSPNFQGACTGIGITGWIVEEGIQYAEYSGDCRIGGIVQNIVWKISLKV